MAKKNVLTPERSLLFEADGVTPKAGSFDSIRNRVSSALQARINAGDDMDMDGDNDRDQYCWIMDIYPDKVVYSMNSDSFMANYTDDGETVTVADPVKVEQSYTLAESRRFLGIECAQLTESYDSATGKLTMKIIQPGFNKSKARYYPAAVLKKSASIFEGAKMFADHQTEKDAKDRPEGSVHNWVATVQKVWAEHDGTIMGEAAVIDPPFKAKLEELKKQNMLGDMGVSIRALGESSPSTIEGVDTNCVESLLAARSVDFVTYAGAGGRVEAMESAQAEEFDLDVVTEAQLRQRRPDLVSLVESHAKGAQLKTLEQQLQEAQDQLKVKNTELATATAKLQESEKVAKKVAAAAELTKLLTESKLPEVAQGRIKKQFAEALTTEGMADAVTAEKDYVKSLGVVVRNNGAASNGAEDSTEAEVEKQKANLVESFKSIGMTEAEAKIAARIQ